MEYRPIKSWSYPGALLDALVDTRKAVASIELPLPTSRAVQANELMATIIEQLDHHLIPRVRDQASPAIVVVGGPTGAGKSTVVNALLGERLTESGVLRPTTKVPHVFYHPLDGEVLDEVSRKASLHATDAVPRGLVVVDSPDLDSVSGENRAIASDLIQAADLWIFATTPARYADAIPWDALSKSAARGASIAIVLNRTTADVVATVRKDLVDRLTEHGLAGLPLFVVPEDVDGGATLPRDVVGGLGRWLDSVASAAASAIVERTLHGSVEALKDWLEQLALHMDDQAMAAKQVRSEVRRCAAQAEMDGGPQWFTAVGAGAVEARWSHATVNDGALFNLSNSLWTKRRAAREARDAALRDIRADLVASLEAHLSHAATSATDKMMASLASGPDRVGTWLAEQRDPRDARAARERRASDAAREWLSWCERSVAVLPGSAGGMAVVGDEGLGVTLASAAVGVEPAAAALAVLTGETGIGVIQAAREELTKARRNVINKEALGMMRPTDSVSLSPEASSVIRLRRAELRALL